MSNWYKEAQNSVSWVDSQMSRGDIAQVREIKNWSTGTTQGAENVTMIGSGLSDGSLSDSQYGISVDLCGQEPVEKGGCGKNLQEYGDFYNYSVSINEKKYRA